MNHGKELLRSLWVVRGSPKARARDPVIRAQGLGFKV